MVTLESVGSSGYRNLDSDTRAAVHFFRVRREPDSERSRYTYPKRSAMSRKVRDTARKCILGTEWGSFVPP